MGYMGYMRHSGRAENLRTVRKLLWIVVRTTRTAGASVRSTKSAHSPPLRLCLKKTTTGKAASRAKTAHTTGLDILFPG